MDRITLAAPAKINLSLEVRGRRADGYHEIATLMVPLSLHDSVTLIRKQRGIEVVCPGRPELDGEANLAYRAAERYLSAAGSPGGVRITIRKRIPIQAGLGGGSSDAAAVLRGLQRLAETPLSAALLHPLATRLGADVPFFLQDLPCRASGIGEVLCPVADLPRFWVVLACAPFGLSTREVYDNLKNSLTAPTGDDTYCCPVLMPALARLVPVLRNDLQPVGEQLRPVIRTICEEMLQSGALGAMMSGSGPTVFGILKTHAQAAGVLAKMKREGWMYLVARGNPARKRATV